MATLDSFNSIAVKIGSSLLVDEHTGLVRNGWLEGLSHDIATLIAAGKKITIISSGAIALGRKRLGLENQPLSLAQKQACAAAGQALLTGAYEDALAPHGLVTAQALLTLNDTEDRRRWINAKETLSTLSSLGAVTIINENDTVATDEIRYGDNDRLAARVAQMISADILVLLSDIDGLYDADPSQSNTANFIPLITNITPEIMAMGGGANQVRGTGSGGMATKLIAAKIATDAGCTLVITKGDRTSPLGALQNSETKASWFTATTSPRNARKQWIAGSLKSEGQLIIDDGAARALMDGKSLLSAGLLQVKGNFGKGASVVIATGDGREIARGLAGYGAGEMKKITGLKSNDIAASLGYDGGAAIVHRDNLVLSI